MRLTLCLCLVGLLISGCSFYDAERDTDERAANHMRVADSLQQASSLAGAAFEYSLVAQHYPSSSSYPTALRKAAMLYLNPENPARNDSVAMQCLSTYLALPLKTDDRESGRIYIALLERISRLEEDIARRERSADSLAAVVRKHGTAISAQNQRAQELEAQVKSAAEELKKLKDVDVRISKSRKRQP